jgi:hypothetical protein
MLRIKPLRNVLLILRPRLPFWFRRWLAMRLRQLALRLTLKAADHLIEAKECRADALAIEPTEPTEHDKGDTDDRS